jgi:N-acetylmuramoyl-L-alanine amidase
MRAVPNLASAYESLLHALCVYREARGEPTEGKRAVAWSITNRSRDKRWPRMISEVVLQRNQFSSFSPGDPNAALLPHWDDAAWQQCCAVVDEPGDDPTGGANSYHAGTWEALSPASRKFFDRSKATAVIGGHTFYKL